MVTFYLLKINIDLDILPCPVKSMMKIYFKSIQN